MAQEGKDALRQLAALLVEFPGLVFYQPGASDLDTAGAEVRAALDLNRDRLVVKLPARTDYFSMAADFRRAGAQVAITAIYTPAQALVAAACGASWIIPYVNRAKRLLPDGDDLVRQLAATLRSAEARTTILAASIKSAEEAVQAVADGATGISAPLSILTALGNHELSDQALEEFAQAARASGASHADVVADGVQTSTQHGS
jgi:transaldolase